MDDIKILDLLWARAESALDALAVKFGPRLYRTAMNILSDPTDAEEVVNDTYLSLWNSIPPNRPDPLPAYVYRVGKNIALKHLRAKTAQKRSNGYDLSLEELSEVIPGSTPEDTLNARLLGDAINAFLDMLPTESRIIFVRRYWFGDSIRQIAKDRGVSENTLSVRLHRIRNQLKDYLNKEELWHEA